MREYWLLWDIANPTLPPNPLASPLVATDPKIIVKQQTHQYRTRYGIYKGSHFVLSLALNISFAITIRPCPSLFKSDLEKSFHWDFINEW